MGNCCGLCGDDRTKYDNFSSTAPPSRRPAQMSEADREAQAAAAEAALKRQQNFEKSAVGRAAYKGVNEAKKVEAKSQGPSAADWAN